MFRRLLFSMLLAAPTAAAVGQPNEAWGIAAMPNGCMIQATSSHGTMLSIWGFAGEAKLGFLLQNREWNGMEDGRNYDLGLDFAGQQRRLVQATAREHIDSDGPGFFFTVEPGVSEGSGFLRNFTSAKGMTISHEGQTVDTLSLAGSRGAMSAFAKCLSEHWAVPVASTATSSGDKDDDDSGKPASSATV
jgi:hypothetical protein